LRSAFPIGQGSVQGFFGSTPNVASGTLGVWDFGSGAVIAGAVGSGAVQSGNLASGQIGTNHFASGGVVRSGNIGSGAVVGRAGGGAFVIASGTVGVNDLGSGAVVSGNVSSGVPVTYARNVFEDTMTAGLTLSGFLAVCYGSGDVLVTAERQSGLRLPAIGVTITNATAGNPVTFVRWGKVLVAASGAIASGNTGAFLYVGSAGLLRRSADGRDPDHFEVLSGVRRLIGQQHAQDGPEAEHVAAAADLLQLAGRLLGSHVRRGTEYGPVLGVRSVAIEQPGVHHVLDLLQPLEPRVHAHRCPLPPEPGPPPPGGSPA
jgi:hypothetical protein